MFVGWFGWFVGWLVGRPIGRPVCCLVGGFVCVGLSFGVGLVWSGLVRLVGRLVCWSVCSLVGWLVGVLVGWSAVLPAGWLVGW